MSDVIDHGSYRVQWRETGSSVWNAALSNRTIITAADGTTDWEAGTNATVSTASNPSEDGTSIHAKPADTQDSTSRYVVYNPTGTWDLSGHDNIQFWWYTENAIGSRLKLFDESGGSKTVQFDDQVEPGQPGIVQVALSDFEPDVNLTAVDRLRWPFDDGSTGDEDVHIDSVVVGDETVDHDTLSLTIPYLEDGEEYEIRARTETEHVTGSWTTPKSIITTFPAATGLSLSNVTKTSVDLSWTDNADDESGTRVLRARKRNGSWDDYREVADLDPNVTSYTDSSVSPGTEYRYTVQSYTEHTSADSNVETATTPALGVPHSQAGSRGWHVEVTHPGGRTLTPTVVGRPERNQKVNGLPRVRIPVARNDKWSDEAFEQASMRFWCDGEEQPIDELVKVEQQPDASVLVGRGGAELLERVTADFVEEEAHIAAESLVADSTSYVPNVDEPATTSEENVVVQSADTTAEFQNVLTPSATDPYDVQDGEIIVHQSCWFFEGEDEFGTGVAANAAYSGDATGTGTNATYFGGQFGSVGDSVSFDFSTEYDIPADQFQIAWREDARDADDDGKIDTLPNLSVKLDGTELVQYTDGWGIQLGDEDPSQGDLLGWHEHVATADYGGLSTVSAGSHTLTIETVEREESGYDDWFLDCLAVFDARFEYTFDNDNGNTYIRDPAEIDDQGPGYLAGPEPYPDAVEIEFAEAYPTRSVTGGRGEVSITNTQGNHALSLSNDSGATWETATNTATVEHDWDTLTDGVRLRATLARYTTGNATTTPTTGDGAQSLDSYSLQADLQDIPILVNKGYDDRLVDVLRDIADYGNFVFEVRRENGVDSVEWTQPGQRPAGDTTDLISYSFSESTERSVEKAVVFGSSRPIDGETFTASHDAEVGLDNEPVVESSETVRDPDSGTVYERGADYVMRNQTGSIEVLSTGDMNDGSTYEIDYHYKISNSFTANDASNLPQVRRFDFPSIPTTRGCGQAALYLVQHLKDPVQEAEVTVPKQPLGWNVIDAIQVPELPTDSPLQIRDIKQTPGQVTVRLADQPSISDVISDLRDQLGSVSRRV